MSRRVYLHIGAPKTGTSYVQDRLRLNRRSLAAHDVHYPLGPLGLPSSHFKPALDVIRRDWGGALADAEGSWARLMRRVRRLDGTVVISHEILAAADPEQIGRVMEDLAGSEVHVVYSARDLARQVPAAWQESVKQFGTMPYQRFLRRVRFRPDNLWFWMVQDLPAVLERWGAAIPAERVHLVTVPHPGSPQDLLWRRMCIVLGIDPAWAPRDSARGNTSMGGPETTLVRRLNQRLRKAGLAAADHRALVTDLLVHQNLARRGTTSRTVLPPRMLGWAEDVAEQWIGWALGSGIDVVGDLEELRPVRPRGRAHNPDRALPRQMLGAAIDALALMVEEAARRPPPGFARRVGHTVRSVRNR
jgi:hypothetical protein